MESVSDIRKKAAEKYIADKTAAWVLALPQIQSHKNELRNWHDRLLDEDEGSPDRKAMQRSGFNEALEMGVDEVTKLANRYYETQLNNDSGRTWELEYQMGAIDTILMAVRELP
jgi:hypothetical protein